jgi:hypothetical protein
MRSVESADLSEDVDAVGVLVHHALQAPHLALDTPKALLRARDRELVEGCSSLQSPKFAYVDVCLDLTAATHSGGARTLIGRRPAWPGRLDAAFPLPR